MSSVFVAIYQDKGKWLFLYLNCKVNECTGNSDLLPICFEDIYKEERDILLDIPMETTIFGSVHFSLSSVFNW